VQFFSPDGSRDVTYLANYVTLQVRDRLARIKGVADANSLGGQDFTMRIWLDPEKLAGHNLTAGDVTRALREQNLQIAGGALGQPPVPSGSAFQYTLVAQGRLLTEQEFGDVIVKTGEEGEVMRVRDVARVELGARDYSTKTYMDGYNAVSVRVFQLPGSNAIETADDVYRVLREISRSFPPGVAYAINYDPTKIHPRVHDRGDAHAARSLAARRARGGCVPANLAGVDHPAPCRARVADRHARRDEGVRLLAQQPLALRHRARHRHRGR